MIDNSTLGVRTISTTSAPATVASFLQPAIYGSRSTEARRQMVFRRTRETSCDRHRSVASRPRVVPRRAEPRPPPTAAEGFPSAGSISAALTSNELTQWWVPIASAMTRHLRWRARHRALRLGSPTSNKLRAIATSASGEARHSNGAGRPTTNAEMAGTNTPRACDVGEQARRQVDYGRRGPTSAVVRARADALHDLATKIPPQQLWGVEFGALDASTVRRPYRAHGSSRLRHRGIVVSTTTFTGADIPSFCDDKCGRSRTGTRHTNVPERCRGPAATRLRPVGSRRIWGASLPEADSTSQWSLHRSALASCWVSVVAHHSPRDSHQALCAAYRA